MDVGLELIANVGIALVGAVGTFAVLKNRVTRLESDMSDYTDDSKVKAIELNRKLDAQFKKTDTVIERLIVLERDTATHLDMPKAEEKFVSKMELHLHLKNIELTTKNTNSMVEKMEGKLEDLVETLQGINHEK